MRPTFISLKGSIGLQLGISLEEIEIPLDNFSRGIIAISGKKGFGKTTIMDNLHPFRRVAFREGVLQNQFYLKDSHRIFRCIHEGKSYESRLLIDGVTGVGEAYLFKNGNPLNDGKLNSYDDVVREIFGSEALFFNSNFSKQFSLGLGGMKPAELRGLFSELLNYDRYDPLHRVTKAFLAKMEQNYSLAENEIKTLQEQINNITITKDDVDNTILEKTNKLKIIDDTNQLIKGFRTQATNYEVKLSSLKKQREENLQHIEKATTYKNQLVDLKNNFETDTEKLTVDKEACLNEYDNNNTHALRIKELNSNKTVSQEKANIDQKNICVEISILTTKITNIEMSIKSCEESIIRNTRISENVDVIDAKLAEKKELIDKVNLIMQQENKITSDKSSLQTSLAIKIQELNDKKEELTKANNRIDETKNKLEQENKSFETLKSEYDNKVKEYEADIAIIDDTPCEELVGAGCNFLKNAHEKKNQLPNIHKDFLVKLGDKEAEISILKEELELDINRCDNLSSDIEKIQVHIFDNYTAKIDEIDTLLKNIAGEVRTITGQLAEINKDSWEDLKQQANEAVNTIELKKNEKINLEKLLGELTKQVKEKEDTIINIQQILNDNIQDCQKQIDNETELMKNEMERLVKDYNTKIKTVADIYNDKSNTVQKQIEENQQNIVPEIETKITEISGEITKLEENLLAAENIVASAQKEISELETKIGEQKQQIGLKTVNADKIRAKEAELKLYEREIKEYSLLEMAFGKTGIPVLKLENTGPEASNIANDLLSMSDNPFRIELITTEPTKDRKKVKETFKIKILENNHEIFANKKAPTLGDKSGGQQIEVGTALQLAISLIGKRQGRHIETLYLDEKDGSLDIESAYKYFQMIQKIHDLAGVYYTFVITHRPEMLDMIPQRIELLPGKINLITN